MRAKIHETAVVSPGAEVSPDAEIGAFCVISDNVTIGPGTVLEPRVTLLPYVRIGQGCRIGVGAVLGGLPQDNKFRGEVTELVIGDLNQIREYVTMHRATGEGNATIIGDENLLMAYAHVGHNCRVGSGTMISNSVGISGHVTIEDMVVIGGLVGIHQYVSLGRMCMVGGHSKVVQDVPPYMLADGRPAKVYGLNIRGIQRHGVSREGQEALRAAFKLLYRSGLNRSQAMEQIAATVDPCLEIVHLQEFLARVKDGFAGRGLDPLAKRDLAEA